MVQQLGYVYNGNMTSNDNIVNIALDRPRYHHGDLRAAAVTAGLALLEERSVDDFALREVARRIGVSATALYRHFPDKQALLGAIAAAGLVTLGERQREASEAAGDPLHAFVESGIAYVRFAIDHPSLFRLVFATASAEPILDSPRGTGGSAMDQLRDNIARFVADDSSNEAQKAAALGAWALVHGLAMLVLDGQTPDDPELIARVIRQMVPS